MSTINIFGNTIEYQSGIYNEKYLVHESLRWHITDVYGWDMNQSEIREMKLDEILESKKESSYLYNLSLRKKDEDGWGHYTITFNGKVLKLYSTSDGPLRIELKCDSFEKADDLVHMLIEGNNLSLFPVSEASFTKKNL